MNSQEFFGQNSARGTTADLFWTAVGSVEDGIIEKNSTAVAACSSQDPTYLYRKPEENGQGFPLQFKGSLLRRMADVCGAAATHLHTPREGETGSNVSRAEPATPTPSAQREERLPTNESCSVSHSTIPTTFNSTITSVLQFRDSILSNPLYRRSGAPVQCRLSTKEAALLINAFTERYKGSQLHKETICLLISAPAPPNTRQLTVQDLNNYLEAQVPQGALQTTFHCSNCRKRQLKESIPCTNCGRANLGYPGPDTELKHIQVVWVDLEAQLDRLIRSYHCTIQKHMSQGKADQFSDIRDGSVMKEAEYSRVRTGRVDLDLTLLLMSDGGKNTQLGGGHLWPLNLYVCELPRKIRESFTNTVLACLVLCYQEPPAEELVDELLSRVEQIRRRPRKIETKCCSKTVTYSTAIRAFSGDLLCRQSFLNLVGIAGQDACAFCISANKRDEKLQARLFEAPKQWELRGKVLLDFISNSISSGAELPFLGCRGIPTLLNTIEAISVEGLHTEVGMCQLMCHLIFGTSYTTTLKDSCPSFRLNSKSDKGGKREYSRFVQLTRFPASLTNRFKMREILNSTHYSRTEIFWVTTITLIPFVAGYLPQKQKEEGTGLNCFYFTYLFMLCLRKLSISTLRKPDLIYIDGILKLLHERADFYMGSNARGLRFHTFMCHTVDNTRKLSQLMNHSSASMEQSLHFLKTKLELVTKNYAEHAMKHVLRSRATWEAVEELHAKTQDAVVKELCEHVMALSPSCRQGMFSETAKGFEKTTNVGNVTVSRSKLLLDRTASESLRNSAREYFGEQIEKQLDCSETFEMATFFSPEAEEKVLVRVWTAEETKRNSQRSVVEFRDASGIRRFLRVKSFVFVNENMYLFGDRLITQSLLAGLQDPTDPDLLKAKTVAPPGFYRDFWFSVENEKSQIIACNQVLCLAAVMQSVKGSGGGDVQNNPGYVVSCDSCFTAF